MVNMLNVHGNSSVVKFGSWDSNTLQSGQSLMIFPSKSTKEWTLISPKILLNNADLGLAVAKDLVLSPHLPYLYLPEADWSHIAYYLNSIYKINFECDWTGNYCRFTGPCDNYR